ncbi:MAG: serine/threonine-protein kinase [Ignavibacteriaceae bacterium]
MNDWDKLKALFQKAIELSPEERKPFLEEQCRDNPELRKEIEALISAQGKSGGLLDITSIQSGEQDSPNDSSGLFVGMTIGKYKVEKKIGDGGMSVVYSAVRADEHFTRRVAIKFIKRGMDTEDIIKRFKIEQQTLAALNHPNIARIIDGGTTANGLPYFVMELIEGEPVDKYCMKEKLSITDKLKLFQNVCSAVQYAHQNLVIHRDIKPGNIFVTSDGTPKLLDFGIAKLLNSSEGQTNLTRTGFRVMTLEYASPEQLKGVQITTSTDIYSLGVVLYELLTGSFPYKFNNTLPYEVERVICTTEPEKPSTAVRKTIEKFHKGKNNILLSSGFENKNYKKVRRRLAGDIDNIVLKAMQKEPYRRYSSVEQFSEDINRHLTGLPIIARRNSIGYRSKKFYERHRVGVTASVIILLLIIAGAVGIVYQSKVAADERDKAQIEAVKVEKINSFLQDMLSSADPYEKGKDVKVVEILDNASKKIDSTLKGQPEIEAELRTTIGRTYEDLGIYKKAETQYKKAFKIRKSLFGINNEKTANSLQNMASITFDEGDFEKAKVLFEKSINILKEFPNSESSSLAEALNQYGMINVQLGKYDKGIKYFKESYAIYSRKGNQTYNTISLVNNIAWAFDYKGELDSAEAMFRKVLSVGNKLTGNKALLIAHATNNLASILHEKGDYKEAIELYRKSLSIREKVLGEKNPEVALAICNLAEELYYVKQYSESLVKVKKAFQIWKETLPAGHPYFDKIYLLLGRISNEKDEPGKAEQYLQKALKIEYNKLTGHKYYIAETKCELGKSFFLQGRYNKAKSLLLENFSVLKKDLGEKNIQTIYAAKIIAELYLKLKEPEEANKYNDLISGTASNKQ